MTIKNQKLPPCPILFKAQDKSSTQEVYFEDPHEAYQWMLAHQDWTLKKREIVNWNFPLEKTISQECWVKLGELPHL